MSSFEQNLSVSDFICYFFLWILTSIEDYSLLCYHSDIDSYVTLIKLHLKRKGKKTFVISIAYTSSERTS